MPGARTGNAAGNDFATLGQVVAQRARIFVVDARFLVRAKATYLSPARPAAEIPSLFAPRRHAIRLSSFRSQWHFLTPLDIQLHLLVIMLLVDAGHSTASPSE